MSFDPRRYWDERHAATRGLEGVGYLGLHGLNEWMYRVRSLVFARTLRRAEITAKDARILDVGSGTGFYVARWLEGSPREVVAADLAPTACERLRAAFPSIRVVELDVTAPDPSIEIGRFDLISAIDVLYHVVDDAAYRRALLNLGKLLEPGGRLIFTENFLQHTPRRGNAWQVSRRLEEIEAAVHAAGMKIEVRAPWFVIMNAPIDSDSRALALYWSSIRKLCARSRIAGEVLGAALFPLELGLTRVLRESPSSEIAVARRVR